MTDTSRKISPLECSVSLAIFSSTEGILSGYVALTRSFAFRLAVSSDDMLVIDQPVDQHLLLPRWTSWLHPHPSVDI